MKNSNMRKEKSRQVKLKSAYKDEQKTGKTTIL